MSAMCALCSYSSQILFHFFHQSQIVNCHACVLCWQNPDFKDQVTEEYLNERSHFRETGVKTKRYHRGTFIARDESIDGPPLDKNGVYRPRKPRDWDKHYAESGPPKWANFDYAKKEDTWGLVSALLQGKFSHIQKYSYSLKDKPRHRININF